jgi:2-polyprenyl-3-methyl-5-hydroxy-6-metoxy-1,4-benzoquinol methylase
VIKAKELSRQLYERVVAPRLETLYPAAYSAVSVALLGEGSDVLGHDDTLSQDHDFGPRLVIFAPDALPQREALAGKLLEGVPDDLKEPEVGEPPKLRVTTLHDFFLEHFGAWKLPPYSDRRWLLFPEQRLLEWTRGSVFLDPQDTLGQLRHALAYFPRNVWLFRLGYAWTVLGQDGCMLERIGQRNDVLSVDIAWARFAERAMRLAFLLHRRYAPAYTKWLHREFKTLSALTRELLPPLERGFRSDSWKEKAECAWEAYRVLHDATSRTLAEADEVGFVSPPLRRSYEYRGELPMNHRAVGDAIAALVEGDLRGSPGLAQGAPDQWVSDRDLLRNSGFLTRLSLAARDTEKIQLFLPETVGVTYRTPEWADQLNRRSCGDPWGQDWRASQRYRHQEALRFLSQTVRLDACARVLDVGAARGDFTRLLVSAAPGAAIEAVDLSEVGLEYLSRRLPGVVTRASGLPELTGIEGPFDLVVALEVLAYVEPVHWTQSLVRLTELLAPRGVLLIGLNADWLPGGEKGTLFERVETLLDVVSTRTLALSTYFDMERLLRKTVKDIARWARDRATVPSAAFRLLAAAAATLLEDDEILDAVLEGDDGEPSHHLLLCRRR